MTAGLVNVGCPSRATCTWMVHPVMLPPRPNLARARGPVRARGTSHAQIFLTASCNDPTQQLWKAMQIPAGVRVRATDARVRAIADGKPRYDQVANATGVPWYVIGMIHEMEGGLNFATHLHNGDPLTARTVHVPSGPPAYRRSPVPVGGQRHRRADDGGLSRGQTVDDRAHRLPARGLQWLGLSLAQHRRQHALSVERHQQLPKGKFVRDGVFDPNAVSGQIGAMALAAAPHRHRGHQRPCRGGRAPSRRRSAAKRNRSRQAALSGRGGAAQPSRSGRRHAAAAAAQSARLLVQGRRQAARRFRSTWTAISGSSQPRP